MVFGHGFYQFYSEIQFLPGHLMIRVKGDSLFVLCDHFYRNRLSVSVLQIKHALISSEYLPRQFLFFLCREFFVKQFHVFILHIVALWCLIYTGYIIKVSGGSVPCRGKMNHPHPQADHDNGCQTHAQK